MELGFECKGLDKWLKKLAALQGLENNPRIDKTLGRGAERMRSGVVELTPKDTGNLQNKIAAIHIKTNEWTVETNVEYAAFVEFGTGQLGDPRVPHTSKESWVYYSDKLQRFVTTSGQPPAHMFTKGFETMRKKVTEAVSVEIKEIIKNA
jgi:HK97 gp10 family phage protein